MKVFIYIIILIVAVAIIAGFFIIGSPGEERLRRFDERKIQDLQMIQGEIIYYWQNKGSLPSDLLSLNDSIRGFVAPTDPQTDEPYEYRAAGDLKFSLCAVFNLASRGKDFENLRGPQYEYARPLPPKEAYQVDSPASWDHENARHCFERTIDPDIYKPNDRNPA